MLVILYVSHILIKAPMIQVVIASDVPKLGDTASEWDVIVLLPTLVLTEHR